MSLLDDVKRRTDIVQVVSDYVDLDTRSRTPKALCPFHSERTPSFVVYPDSGNWHCFGSCATGGDAISFVMKADNLAFGEALRRLADRAGVQYREETSAVSREQRTSIYDANEVAAAWFLTVLNSPEGEKARDYLQSRGISMEAAERRGIGLAPDGMTTLAGHLRAKNIHPEAARDARLVTQGQDGAWRDFFRGRLTIQIRDERGRLAGFGARSLDGSEPKYLNTPQTDAFDKSAILYGLNWATDAARADGHAVVVEGYMDAITAHEHGFSNVVASMGTAITADQLRLLARCVSNTERTGVVTLSLDNDSAGEEATLRGLEAAWQQFGAALAGGRNGGLSLKVALPAAGKDPDEAIRSEPETWRQSITDATPLLEYLMVAYAGRFDLETGDGKARMAEAVAPLVFAVTNQYEQDRYWTRLAESVGVAPERLSSMIERPRSRSRGAGRAGANRGRKDAHIAREQLSAALEVESDSSLEEHLLTLLLSHDELREFALAVPPEHFHDIGNREIFTAWQGSSTLAGLPGSLDEHLTERVEQLRGRPLPPADHPRRIEDASQCVHRLRERHLRHIVSLGGKALAEYEAQLQGEELEQLRSRSLDPNDRLRQVFTGQT